MIHNPKGEAVCVPGGPFDYPEMGIQKWVRTSVRTANCRMLQDGFTYDHVLSILGVPWFGQTQLICKGHG
jgi:hypothetical protein